MTSQPLGVTATVEVQLNRYKYRFRKLTYSEEFGLELQPGDDARKVILAAAMTEVSGLPISSRDHALSILTVIPKPVLDRVWVLYKSGIPEDRFFTTKGLYRSPDTHQLSQIQAKSEEARSEVVDRAVSQMEAKFGRKEVQETLDIERRLFEDARRRGVVTKATSEEKV
jgi:hypothetical protein